MTPDARQLIRLVRAQEAVVAAGLDVCAVMAVLAAQARELTGAAGAVVELTDASGAVTRAVMEPACGGRGVRLLDVGASARALAERRVVRGHEPGEALLAAPLAAGDRLLGVLTVVAPRPRSFAAADTDALHRVASFAAHQLTGAMALEAAERAGRTDPLTGLGNRRAFDEALSRELAAHTRYGRELTLVVFDLDRFKLVNDLGGHQAGDRVLVQVGRRLSEVRGADAAFRLGGDEFALLLPETTRESAELVARRLVRQVGEDSRPHDVGASWGTAEAVDLDGRALVARADEELYARKRAGRCSGVEALG